MMRKKNAGLAMTKKKVAKLVPPDHVMASLAKPTCVVWERLWEVASGIELAVFEGDGSPVSVVQWQDESHQLLFVTDNGRLFIYRYLIDSESLVADACRRATRNLTWDEWQLYFPNQANRQTCPNRPIHPTALKPSSLPDS